MELHRLSLLCVAAIWFAGSTAAQVTLKNFRAEKGPAGPLVKKHAYPIVLAVDAGEKTAASVKIKDLQPQDAEIQVNGTKVDVGKTVAIAKGEATFTLVTGDSTVAKLEVVPLEAPPARMENGQNVAKAEDGAEIAELKTTFDWSPIARYTVHTDVGPLNARTVYPKAIAIEAVREDGKTPATYQKIGVRVMGKGDASLFVDSKARDSGVTAVTDDAGKAIVGLETGNLLDPELAFTPIDEEGNAVIGGLQTAKLTGLKTFDTFHSRRLYTEVFMGATFTNDYDANGESTGFNKTSPLVRVTFDTLWYNKREDNPGGLLRGSLLHTGVDMETTDFPFGEDAPESGGDPVPGEGDPNSGNTKKGFASAFSGALFAVWQPDHWFWANYTNTSTLTGFPTDALRLGIFTKVGVTTRPTVKAGNGDTSFYRAQLGFRFTHHQTKATIPRKDQDNIVPIRFIEISVARFEEFANEVDANRLVLDAGFRLPGIGSNMIPFYAGIHLNAGRGPDDLRIFAGFLFKINEIAAAFQRAGIE